ncbi:MAG: PhzF family phenazine biosynthesis protein [Peptococcaceae bacterium]|nr:PhzF family phenazine biosynthesis protein [Peptococcaceae bacterium]
MAINIYQVDAFTDQIFSGNPAAVCILPGPVDPVWAQKMAMEMNLSETAFLCRDRDQYHLRWFTPAVEVDLCGHATLASAHILWEEKLASPEQDIFFSTRSGILKASQKNGWVELNFPSKPIQEAVPPPGLFEALGIEAALVCVHKSDYLLEVDSPNIVRTLTPDFSKLRQLPVRGVIVTSKGQDEGFDFISRFFVPGSGIDEDPVTGSAHCCLGPYWKAKLNKDKFLAYQASKRGGMIRVEVEGDRVHLFGQAVTVFKGQLKE